MCIYIYIVYIYKVVYDGVIECSDTFRSSSLCLQSRHTRTDSSNAAGAAIQRNTS